MPDDAPKPQGRSLDELFVLFDLGEFVGAIDSRRVDRVISSEDVSLLRRKTNVSSAGQEAPALTLASLLKLDLGTRAWLILRLPSIGLVALGVGKCVGAHAIQSANPLPDAAFAYRPGALTASFVLRRSARNFGVGSLGIIIDPEPLCFASEWGRAQHAIRIQSTADLANRQEAG